MTADYRFEPHPFPGPAVDKVHTIHFDTDCVSPQKFFNLTNVQNYAVQIIQSGCYPIFSTFRPVSPRSTYENLKMLNVQEGTLTAAAKLLNST